MNRRTATSLLAAALPAGLPPEVPPCDLDGGGAGVTDFLELLANWGPCT